jgi:hypothetical protein
MILAACAARHLFAFQTAAYLPLFGALENDAVSFQFRILPFAAKASFVKPSANLASSAACSNLKSCLFHFIAASLTTR